MAKSNSIYSKSSRWGYGIMNNAVLPAVFCFISLLLSGCRSAQSVSGSSQKEKAPFTFLVLGDWGFKGEGYQLSVAAAMREQSKKQPPALILTVGDNFYENGVKDTTDEHWQLSYENIYKELTRKYAWYASLGNHDYGGNPDAQTAYHAVNTNWNMPARYYTFTKKAGDRQTVRFIVIDTNPYISAYYTDPRYKLVMPLQDTAKQTRWLDSVLASSKEDWKIVVGHHPLYAANARPADTETLLHIMQPKFEKYNVQAYICGHDHILQYNRPEQSKTAYIISGGGGKPASTAPRAAYTFFSSNAPGFTSCSIQGNRLTFSFIDTTGSVLYYNTVSK